VRLARGGWGVALATIAERRELVAATAPVRALEPSVPKPDRQTPKALPPPA